MNLKLLAIGLSSAILIFSKPSLSVAEWNGERAYDWQVQRDQMEKLQREQKLQQEQMRRDMQEQQQQQDRWQREQRQQTQEQQFQQLQMQRQQEKFQQEQRKQSNSRSNQQQTSTSDKCSYALQRMQIACNQNDPDYWMYGLGDTQCAKAQAMVDKFCN